MSKVVGERFESPIGELELLKFEDALIYIGFNKDERSLKNWLSKHGLQKQIEFCSENSYISSQILSYLTGKTRSFDFSYRLFGTEFQLKVWKELLSIPYGTTVTYKHIANNMGYRVGFQAVGQAIGKNPLPLVVPCHRVIGSTGELTGYAEGLEIKKYLLNLEAKM